MSDGNDHRRGIRKLVRATLLVLCTCLIGACGDEPEPRPAGALPASVDGDATIRGVVRFDGEPPKMNVIPNDKCHLGAPPLREEFVVVGDDGGLANVIVYLEDGPKTDGAARDPLLLDQKHCRFDPHVLVVQVGQPLKITSSDETMHNVHYDPKRNDAVNLAMTGPGESEVVSFDAPEFFDVRCDVHPWMNAWIGVVETPFAAVTDDGGRFSLEGVPAGTYSLVAWHERYGERRQEMTVESGESVDVDFTYAKP